MLRRLVIAVDTEAEIRGILRREVEGISSLDLEAATKAILELMRSAEAETARWYEDRGNGMM